MTKAVAFAPISEATLAPAPIPADWIVQGAPMARVAELSRSVDGTAVTAVWDCTAGEFDWFFAGDETVHILEGEVTVQDGGATRTLRAGDVAYFPAGTTSRWTVHDYVKKLAFCRDSMPNSLLRGLRIWRRLKALVRGGGGASSGALLGAGAAS